MLRELVTRNRSCRRFQKDRMVGRETLRYLVELARLTPSASNLQPMKFLLSWTPERNETIFPCLRWAGYLTEWPGPAEGERPTAYVVILGDTEIAEHIPWDQGIVAQTMMLGAVEKGLAGCIIASVDRDRLRKLLEIPKRYQILLVLALGYQAQTIVIEEMKEGNVRYWEDEKGIHYVPKRSVEELILDI